MLAALSQVLKRMLATPLVSFAIITYLPVIESSTSQLHTARLSAKLSSLPTLTLLFSSLLPKLSLSQLVPPLSEQILHLSTLSNELKLQPFLLALFLLLLT